MVMCGVRLQSQRRLLLVQQGLRTFQVMQTMLGPQRGSTETLVQLWRQRMGRPGPMLAASIGLRHASQVEIKRRQIDRSLLAEARRQQGQR